MKRFIVAPIIALVLLFGMTFGNFYIINSRIDKIKAVLQVCADYIDNDMYEEGIKAAEEARGLWEDMQSYVGITVNEREASEIDQLLHIMIEMIEIKEYAMFKKTNIEAYMHLDWLIENEKFGSENIL